MDEMEKDKLIKSALRKYKKLFKDIDEDKNEFAIKLYQQAAFMEATLAELQETINAEGAVVTAVNGNGFEVTSEHPAQVSYNKMIKNYNATIKALADILPEKQKDDALLQYLRSNKR